MPRGGRGARGARLVGVVSSVLRVRSTWADAERKTGAGLFMLNRCVMRVYRPLSGSLAPSLRSDRRPCYTRVARDFAKSEPHVLLLERSNESNNGGTWSMPGGNFDHTLDKTLYDTAVREALEELGSVPDITAVLGSIVVDWGKDDQNQFTVYFVETTANDGAWSAELNEEHTGSAWFALSDLGDEDVELHPVVEQLTSFSAMEVIGKMEFLG